MSKCKFDFVDDTLTKPTDPAKFSAWRCIQALLVQWLLNTMEDSVKITLAHYEEVKPLWDTLYRRYGVADGPRSQELKTALAACKQTGSMTVQQYFVMLEPLWDELAQYVQPPHCKCGECVIFCYFGGDWQEQVDEDKFHDFLFGLNADLYGNVRSSLLALHPTPTLDRAYQALLQQERLLKSAVPQAPREDVLAFAVQASGMKQVPAGVTRTASGALSGSGVMQAQGGNVTLGSGQAAGDRTTSRGRCYYCNKPGH